MPRNLLTGQVERHGFARASGHAPEYDIWRAMIRRCEREKNADYARYGGKGIRVHPLFRASFKAFYAEVGPRPSPSHSIDRIDGTRGYEPGNLRWATPQQQARNHSRVKKLTIDGVTKTVPDWAEHPDAAVSVKIINKRLRAGWEPRRAVFGRKLTVAEASKLGTFARYGKDMSPEQKGSL